jgi:hypothetical protein
VSFANVLQPHIDASLARIEGQSLVIMVQDTTELDLTRPQKQVVGAGPMDGSSRRGIFLHLLHAFTSDGTPLGTTHAVPWAREVGAVSRSKLPSHERVAIPIEQKESYRWVTTLEQTQRMAAQLPGTQFVCVACPSGEVHLESRATVRDDSRVGADGPVMEITRCLEAAPSIYAGLPSSTISAAAA